MKCKLNEQWDITTCPSEWLKSKIVTKPYIDENEERLDHSCIAGRNIKCYRHFGKQLGSFLKKELNMQLLYDTAIALLGIYLNDMVTKTWMKMFIVPLFTIAKNWKQSSCPFMGE